ncbi:MAG TPA: hypothetical protein VGP08_09975 [Pyrinomonadaceae bacterium]|jgi:hypothetical protein|nr:hypothetical protein [Pyrinomonadaceae bacterium]
MGDWIGLGIIVAVVVGALVGMSYLGRKPKQLTADEYERRVATAKGTTRGAAIAGLYAMQKLLNPKAVEAIEVQRDLKAGFYNDAEKKGDGDDEGVDVPIPEEEVLKPKDEEEKDA